MQKRTGADKISTQPVTTFSITSSPITYRMKSLAYLTILTLKLLATHRTLTIFKKRQKLLFCNKNCENNFSFRDVSISNVATTHLSSSYHLIQLFKYYKTMSLRKIRNTYWSLCQPWRKLFKTARIFHLFSFFGAFRLGKLK